MDKIYWQLCKHLLSISVAFYKAIFTWAWWWWISILAVPGSGSQLLKTNQSQRSSVLYKVTPDQSTLSPDEDVRSTSQVTLRRETNEKYFIMIMKVFDCFVRNVTLFVKAKKVAKKVTHSHCPQTTLNPENVSRAHTKWAHTKWAHTKWAHTKCRPSSTFPPPTQPPANKV